MRDDAPPEPAAAKPARAPPPVTRAYLDRAALAYLERFAASQDSLRRVLARKVETRCRLRGEDPAPYRALVDEAVARAAASGLVDDRRFADGRIATLRRRGGSTRAIAARLAAKGVEREVIATALAEDETGELAAARAFARRRRLGIHRAEEERAARRDKDLAALARAGFPYPVAKAALDGDEE